MSLKTLLRAALTAAILALPLFPAEAQQLPDRIRQAGKIVIATNPNYAPITYKDPATNRLTGLDIDLGEAIGRELGLRVEWQEIAFAQMLPSLQTGRVDMIMAGMADIPARRESADFINYFWSGAQFVTIQANRNTIRTPEDLCGKRVGASRATTWPRQIEEWSAANCVARGRPAMIVVGTEGSVDMRTQLKSQRLDGGVQGGETLHYFQTLEPNTYVILGEPFTRLLAGIPFQKNEEGRQLRAAVRAALERMKLNGAYDRAFAAHGVSANRLTAITENQGE
jgi:polar amino acid transport system substrate-binding protein